MFILWFLSGYIPVPKHIIIRLVVTGWHFRNILIDVLS